MIVKRGNQWCLISKTTGKTLGCHDSRAGAQAQERAIKARQNMKLRLSVEQMQKICPPCAEKMVAQNIKELKLDFTEVGSLAYQLSEQALAGLCDKFGGPEGFRTKCMDSSLMGEIEDAGAFCNWLKIQCHGSSAASDIKADEYEFKTHDVKDVEVFAVGEWNGRQFSERDLDVMVESFNKTKDRLKPYVKLGHDKDQKFLKNDGLPAAGWVENLRRIGSKLIADFKRVPEKIKALIDAGAYRRVSVELIEKYRIGDHVYDLAMSGIALLGAKTPAVDNLSDVLALYGKEYELVAAYNAGVEIMGYSYQPSMIKEEVSMNDDVKKQQENNALAELQAKFSMAETKIKELESALVSEKTKTQEAENKITQFVSEKKALEMSVKVDALIKENKLSPAQKDLALALFNSGMTPNMQEFSVGDKKYKAPEELLFALLEAGVGVSLNEGGKTNAGIAVREDVKDGVVGIEMDRKIKQRMEEKKVSYKEAYLAILQEATAA